MTDTPVPDVRELAAAAVTSAGRCDHPGAETCDPWWIADAVLAAVTPVIRRQERDEIRHDITEKIDLRRRAALATARDRAEDNRQQVYSAGQATAYEELAERLDRYFDERAAAIARSHSTPKEQDHG